MNMSLLLSFTTNNGKVKYMYIRMNYTQCKIFRILKNEQIKTFPEV